MLKQEEDPLPRKLGCCNYCNTLGPVYEQESEHKILFVVCAQCLRDITQSEDPSKLFRGGI